MSSDVFDTEHFSGFISCNREKDLSEKDAVDKTLHIAQVNSLSTQLPTSDVELGEADGTESSLGRLKKSPSFAPHIMRSPGGQTTSMRRSYNSKVPS